MDVTERLLVIRRGRIRKSAESDLRFYCIKLETRGYREINRLEGQQEIARRMVESEPFAVKTDEDEQMEIEEEIDEEKKDGDRVLRLGEIKRIAYDEEVRKD